MRSAPVRLPPTTDPLGLVATLVVHLQSSFGAVVQSYDADPTGTISVTLRIRPGLDPAPDSPRSADC
jgi:hypothetical protein